MDFSIRLIQCKFLKWYFEFDKNSRLFSDYTKNIYRKYVFYVFKRKRFASLTHYEKKHVLTLPFLLQIYKKAHQFQSFFQGHDINISWTKIIKKFHISTWLARHTEKNSSKIKSRLLDASSLHLTRTTYPVFSFLAYSVRYFHSHSLTKPKLSFSFYYWIFRFVCVSQNHFRFVFVVINEGIKPLVNEKFRFRFVSMPTLTCNVHGLSINV